MTKNSTDFDRLVEIIAKLRDPIDGCPWDLKQDHKTLRKYMLEEAYEAVEAMGNDDDQHLIEELGDVLLQVILNGQILKDSGKGDIGDIIESISAKMIRRHPHVFDKEFGKKSIEEIKKNWQDIKAIEKPEKKAGAYSGLKFSPLPALTHSVKIGKKAHEINFDWSSPAEVLEKVKEELLELEVEIASENNLDRISDEMGDLLFSIAQLARHLGIDPEVAAAHGNQKFIKRFELLESFAQEKGAKIENLNQMELEELWVRAKKTSNPN